MIKDPNGGRTNNARKVDDKTEMIFNGLFKNQLHKPTPTEIARSYDSFLNGYAEVFNQDTGELYDPKDFKALSNATVINYINKWENKLATHKARSGDRQVYMGKYKPHHQMDLPTFSGSILSVDDRNPPFVYNTKNERVWFYLGVDIASRCFTTFVYGKTKEGIIVDFYRQMVRNYTEWGFCLPNELECESSLNSAFKDTLLRDGNMFQKVKIEANNARGKYIERMNEKLRYEVEKSAPGWLARPNAKSEANQASGQKKQVIPYDILVNERLLELEQWNNSPHPDNKNISRWDYFEQNQHPDLKPTNWIGILPTIGYKTTTSCNGGYVRLQGKKRAIADEGKILTGEALIQQMKIIEGKEFDVYWLDGNDGQVLKALVYINGKFVCEVMEMPRYNRATIERTDADNEAIKLQNSYVASVDAFEKDKENELKIFKLSTIHQKQLIQISEYQILKGMRHVKNQSKFLRTMTMTIHSPTHHNKTMRQAGALILTYKPQKMNLTNEFKEKVRLAILEKRENYGGSDAEFSKSLSINNAIYSRIKKGEIERVLSDTVWITIGRQLQVKVYDDNWKVARTTVYTEIEDNLNFCKELSRSMVLVDDCGIGKTFCTKHIIKRMKNTFYVDCSQAKSKQQFIKLLARTLGIDNQGKYNDILENVKYYITTLEKPLIILDEAGDLQYDAF